MLVYQRVKGVATLCIWHSSWLLPSRLRNSKRQGLAQIAKSKGRDRAHQQGESPGWCRPKNVESLIGHVPFKHGWSIYWMFFPFEYGLLDHSPFFLGWSSHIFPFKSSFLKRNFPAMDDRRVPQLHPVALSWPRGVTFFFPPSPAPCCPNKPDDWCSGHCVVALTSGQSTQSTRQYPSIENPLGFSMDTPP